MLVDYEAAIGKYGACEVLEWELVQKKSGRVLPRNTTKI
jgi:hypothetical protein